MDPSKDGQKQSGSPVGTEFLKEHKLPSAVLATALNRVPDNPESILCSCMDGGVYVVDLEMGKWEIIGRHESFASGVISVPGSGLAVSAGYDGFLRWHDVSQRREVRKVQAHGFWSWQLAASPDHKMLASVSGAYRAGGYRYEPAPSDEPTVRVYDSESGQCLYEFQHGPPVLSVAFSTDGKFLAVGNMMGEVSVWELASQRVVNQWRTPDFTSWGIIKSHHYIGGIFSMAHVPQAKELVLAGMGPMNDPMAGNGKQTWQRFAWGEGPAKKLSEIQDSERGNGLMECIRFHSKGDFFVMGGRLAQGKWNVGVFDSSNGRLVHTLDSKMRVTSIAFPAEGDRLVLGGAVGQEKKKDGKHKDFGRLKVYQWKLS